MIDSDKLLERIEKMGNSISDYSKAKAERVYIEQYRKSLKAILMGRAHEQGIKTIAEREVFAYSNDDYIKLITGLKGAVEIEEKCRWALERLKMEIEVWRTIQCNERFQQDRV